MADGSFVKTHTPESFIRPNIGPRPRAPRELVGTALTARIAWLVDIKASKACNCKNLSQQMDLWGIAGCEQNRQQIINHLVGQRALLVEALKTQSQVASMVAKWLPDIAVEVGAEYLLNQAIEDVRANPPIRPCKRKPVQQPIRGRRRTRRTSLAERSAKVTAKIIDVWREGMPITTEDQQSIRLSVCGSCPLKQGNECTACKTDIHSKVKALKASCPAGKWFDENETYTPLINPVRNLLFHIYPRLGAEWNWHWHLDQIKEHAHKFNGKICIGIATGDGLASAETVQEMLSGVPVTDWIIKQNTRQAETVTFTDLLRCVQSDNPNEITFRGHCKGVTHNQSGIEFDWAKMMWQTCSEIESVERALASHVFAGALKCHEPLLSKKMYHWFYAGTFFWFRSKQVFERNWSYSEPTRWFAEYWPGLIASNDESACLCHDFTDGSVLSASYWREVVEPDLLLWRSAR